MKQTQSLYKTIYCETDIIYRSWLIHSKSFTFFTFSSAIFSTTSHACT